LQLYFATLGNFIGNFSGNKGYIFMQLLPIYGYKPFNWCEWCGAAAQNIGEAIPKHTVAPWRQHFGGFPRRLNKPAVYDHTGRKTRNQKN